ncbi:hypothetical protein D3C71_1618810 [compost metagenome]
MSGRRLGDLPLLARFGVDAFPVDLDLLAQQRQSDAAVRPNRGPLLDQLDEVAAHRIARGLKQRGDLAIGSLLMPG